jgi:hypothetical protein
MRRILVLVIATLAFAIARCSTDNSAYALLCDDPVWDHVNAAGDSDVCCCDGTCQVVNRQPRACFGQCPVDELDCALNDAGPD